MSENSSIKSHLQIVGRTGVLASWVIFGLFGLSNLMFVGVLWVLPPSVRAYLGDTTVGKLLMYAAIYVFAVVAVILIPYWFARFRHKTQTFTYLKHLLGLDNPLRLKAIGYVFLAFVSYFVATILAGFLAELIPGYNVNEAQDTGFSSLTNSSDLVLAFIALVILPPIAEELLFRGYLFGKLRAKSGFWFSAIITSLIFGLVHLQWNVGVDTFVLSLFLCFLREKTGSIWASMLLHGMKNGLAYFFLFIAPLLGIQVQ